MAGTKACGARERTARESCSMASPSPSLILCGSVRCALVLTEMVWTSSDSTDRRCVRILRWATLASLTVDGEGEDVYNYDGQVGAVGIHLDGEPPSGVLDLALGGELPPV